MFIKCSPAQLWIWNSLDSLLVLLLKLAGGIRENLLFSLCGSQRSSEQFQSGSVGQGPLPFLIPNRSHSLPSPWGWGSGRGIREELSPELSKGLGCGKWVFGQVCLLALYLTLSSKRVSEERVSTPSLLLGGMTNKIVKHPEIVKSFVTSSAEVKPRITNVEGDLQS